MKVYIINEISSSDKDPGIDEFHYTMFHGLAERNGIRSPHFKHYNYGDDPIYPLCLIKNAYNIKKIFMPSVDFTISNEVKTKIQHLPHIKFWQVKFIKLFNYEYDLYGFLKEGYKARCACKITKKMRHNPELEKVIENYYELLTCKHQDIVEGYKNLKHIRIYTGCSCEKYFEDDLSEEMLKDYPILWHYGGHILSEEAFKLMEPYFDWTYFYYNEVEI